LRRAAAALCGVAVLASCLAGGAARASATKLFVTSYINSNEIQGITVWKGLLTLATLGGIATYDTGTDRFEKILRSPAGLPSNDVLCVEVSPSGALWAGTADAGIARLLPNGSFRRTLSSFDGLPGDRVQALYVRGDTVWVGTGAGLALLIENPSNGQLSLTRTYTSASTAGALVGDDVRAFLQVADTLWCATTAGLSSFAAGVWQERRTALSRPATSLAFHADTLWAATDLGPYRYADGVFRAANSGHAFASQVLFADAAGFYSGSKSSGVRRYVSGVWLAHGSGIPSPQVAVLRDGPDGSLWAGTIDGIARYVLSADSWDARRSDGPRVSAARRAIVDSRGVWFATGNAYPPGSGRGVVLHYDGGWSAITSGTTGGSFQSSDAFGILSDREGRLWIGHCCASGDPRPRLDLWDPATDIWSRPSAYNIITLDQAPSGLVYAAGVEMENGAYVFDAQTAALLDSLTPANTGGGLSSNNLRAVRFDAAGKGWFGSAARGLDVWDGKGTLDHADDVWAHHDVSPSNEVTSLAVLDTNTAWIGTTSGAGRLVGNGFTRVLTTLGSPGLPSGQVNDLALDSRGNVWIATSGGLVRADASGSGGIEIFTTQDGLVDEDVQALAWDAGHGALWVGTGKGISRVVPVFGDEPGFTDRTYVYPNPSRAAGGSLKIGGIQNALDGEIRDVSGALIREFHCDPASNEIWDLKSADGSPASSGIYLVVLRDKGRTKILRAAVVR
jgi:ligand-binding sensor domain-containing protein